MNDSIKIIRFHELSGIEALQIDEVKKPIPEHTEILMKVDAFALNQADILTTLGYHYIQPSLPSSLGSEASGTVVGIGPGVTKFKIGDRVTCVPHYNEKFYPVQGDHCLMLEQYLTHTPDEFTNEEATSFWMQFLTAYFALFDMGNVKKGDYILIPAASSSAGQGGVKLAKDIGAIVIGTTTSEDKRQFLLDIGVDFVINTKTEDIVRKILEYTNDKGINFSYDPIGGEFTASYLDALGWGATIVIYGLLDGSTTELDILRLLRKNSQMLCYSLINYANDPVKLEKGQKYILERIKNGKLRPIVDKVFSFEQTVDAYRYMQSAKQKGKIVVKIE
ncbi:zinc-dependent alcohol dehydrogenase family protein [Tenacibaculum xiamenense]|uniref:zinc-dependent alcohol dehydrogenase family protein n=1 Tax=Tenacibaculum xiamenense TaxID=1261553 RepID=UPI0038940EAE